MSRKPFFEDSDSSFFDAGGMPIRPGIYEFRRFDGRKILYTLEAMEPDADGLVRMKVSHASRMADYPYPAHALNTLDGDWVRYLGSPSAEDAAGADSGENPPLPSF
jgi:hypothetical protein